MCVVAYRLGCRLAAAPTRRLGARPHVSPDQAAALDDLVGGSMHTILELLVGRQVGLVDALALGVELPAVIDAADAVALRPPEER